MWIDTHTHLWDERFDQDRDKILSTLGKELKYIVEIGVDKKTSHMAVSTAYKNEFVYAVVGVHPHDAKNFQDGDYDEFKKLTKMDKVVGIGEIGLDFFKKYSPPTVQKKRFIQFLELAKKVNLPIVLHIRDAYTEVIDILSCVGFPEKGGVVHSFLSDYTHAKRFLDMNLFLGIGGPVTFNKNGYLRDMLKKVPIDKIVTETDCPYLTPVPKRGYRNEPAYVKYVVEQIAAIKNIPVLDAEEILCENAVELFSLPEC